MYLFAFYDFIRGYNCPWPIQTCSRKVHWCPSPGSWLFLLVQGTYTIIKNRYIQSFFIALFQRSSKMSAMFNRPSVAGGVLQTLSPFIH